MKNIQILQLEMAVAASRATSEGQTPYSGMVQVAKEAQRTFAWAALGWALFQCTLVGKPARRQLLEAAWDLCEANKRDIESIYLRILTLIGRQNKGSLGLSTLMFPPQDVLGEHTGKASGSEKRAGVVGLGDKDTHKTGKWMPVPSVNELVARMATDPELKERLFKAGRAQIAYKGVRAVWNAAPTYIRDEIAVRMVSARFSDEDRKVKTSDGVVNAWGLIMVQSLYGTSESSKAQTAAAKGAEKVLQSCLKLGMQWQGSADFWAELTRPSIKIIKDGDYNMEPGSALPDDASAYTGEVVPQYTSCIKTYCILKDAVCDMDPNHQVIGLGSGWNFDSSAKEDGDAISHHSYELEHSEVDIVAWRIAAMDAVTRDYAEAAEEVMQLALDMEAALPLPITYAWEVKTTLKKEQGLFSTKMVEEKEFIAYETREEAFEFLVADKARRDAQYAADNMGIELGIDGDLVEAVYNSMPEEEAAILRDILHSTETPK